MNHFTVKIWILPPVGFEPRTSWSKVKCAKHSTTQTLPPWKHQFPLSCLNIQSNYCTWISISWFYPSLSQPSYLGLVYLKFTSLVLYSRPVTTNQSGLIGEVLHHTDGSRSITPIKLYMTRHSLKICLGDLFNKGTEKKGRKLQTFCRSTEALLISY